MSGDIYVLNSIALDAAKYLMETKKRELERKFPPFFMRLAERCMAEGDDIARCIRENISDIMAPSVYCAEMAEGGILNVLWYMARECHTGFEISLKKIPIAQQSVEILEVFDINPYYARSRGTWLVLAGDSAELTRSLDALGIPYEKIGAANNSRACTILNGENVRYLDRPQREELEKIAVSIPEMPEISREVQCENEFGSDILRADHADRLFMSGDDFLHDGES